MLDLEQLIPFYGLGEDELHLAFNFLFFHCELDPEQMRPIVEGVERMLPEGAWPVWTGSNHDGKRLATRWAGGDPARTRAALMILLGLRGTPFLYYGDEIGLPDTPTFAPSVVAGLLAGAATATATTTTAVVAACGDEHAAQQRGAQHEHQTLRHNHSSSVLRQ